MPSADGLMHLRACQECDIIVLWYQDNNLKAKTVKQIERVQTGLRLEKRMVKVLKGLAEHLEMSTADLVEGIVLHAFDGKPSPFRAPTLEKIGKLKDVYDMDIGAEDAHKLIEAEANEASR